MVKKNDLLIPFEKIKGIKKVVRCKSCGKKIEISNFNRSLCNDCGYRGSKKAKTEEEIIESLV
jgi:ribosomal protein L37E